MDGDGSWPFGSVLLTGQGPAVGPELKVSMRYAIRSMPVTDSTLFWTTPGEAAPLFPSACRLQSLSWLLNVFDISQFDDRHQIRI